jgi:hypothetical protein
LVWKESILLPNPGTAQKFGTEDINKISQLFKAGPFPYDYIIYTDAADSNKVKAINGSTSEIEFPNANASARLTFKSVFDALTSTGLKGGRVLIKNGIYLIDNISTSIGLEIGNTTDGASQFLLVEGESREGVIIQATYAPTIAYHSWLCRTNALFRNITFDGNSLGTDGMMSLLSSFGAASVMQVDNCKFKRARGIHLYYGSIQLGPIVKNCIFENASGVQDQLAFQSINSAYIEGCLFDRTTGTSVGSMLTSGVGNDIHIKNNTFRGATTTSALWAISIEAFGDYNRVQIEGNICENRCINIGSTGTWAYLYKAISIKNNILNKGYIRIVGPDSSYTNSIKYVDIDGNTLIDSLFFGIGCYRIGDSLLIQNNFIKDSNNTLTSPTNGWGLIYTESCTYVRIKGNMLRMSDNTSNASPFGIGFALCTDITIKNNDFANTTSNPNYNDFATSTTVVQPVANADTSGATLPNVEIEVNQIKQLLRDLGLMV